jgi:hypothetical protein
MPESLPPTQRREFLGHLAAGAALLATACAPAVAATGGMTPQGAAAGGASPRPASKWDDSWALRLTAPHKAVFDWPEHADGTALWHAQGYLDAVREIHAEPAQAVIVIRHAAIGYAFNHAMWDKYPMGDFMAGRGATAHRESKRNPYQAGAGSRGSSIEGLIANGVTFVGCALAARGTAATMASRTQGNADAIYEELTANVVPGVIMQPTGVYAVHRAQERGCGFIRST